MTPSEMRAELNRLKELDYRLNETQKSPEWKAFMALAEAQADENKILRDALFPRPEIKDTAPLILYFGTKRDRDDFQALIREAKPAMVTYKV